MWRWALLLAAGCGLSTTPASAATKSKVAIVAGENEYGNVASQIGGNYVEIYSVGLQPEHRSPHL